MDGDESRMVPTWTFGQDHGHEKFNVGEAMSISPTLLRPTSLGSVTLRSGDPFDAPLIDPKYVRL